MIRGIQSLSNGQIPYLTTGSGPDAIFFHGGVATPDAYLPLLERLGGHFRITAPVLPGHGTSMGIISDWTPDDYTSVITDFAAARGIRPALVAGHSFGGMIAILTGARYPGSRIIALSPCGLPYPMSRRGYISLMAGEIRILLAERVDLAKIEGIVPAVPGMLTTAITHPGDVSWLERHAFTFDISQTLGSLTNAIALIWGEKDRIVPVSVGLKMSALCSRAKLRILPEYGHIFSVTMPDLTYREMMNILNRPD